MKTYHVGLIRGTGNTPYWSNGHRKSTVVITMRENIDCMTCDLWQYLGTKQITKQEVRKNKDSILIWINGYFNENFKTVIVD